MTFREIDWGQILEASWVKEFGIYHKGKWKPVSENRTLVQSCLHFKEVIVYLGAVVD